MSQPIHAPLVIRGRVIETCDVAFGGRRDGVSFFAPDASAYVNDLTLSAPSKMADLYDLRFEDLVDYLVELGERLPLSKNAHIKEAFEVTCQTSGLTAPILQVQYE